MDEKEILAFLGLISLNLDKIQSYIQKNDWDNVGLAATQAKDIQVKIATLAPHWDTLLSKNLSLKKEYDSLREAIVTKTATIMASIEEWKLGQLEKISASRNILDNISKYYHRSTQSYYIDTNE